MARRERVGQVPDGGDLGGGGLGLLAHHQLVRHLVAPDLGESADLVHRPLHPAGHRRDPHAENAAMAATEIASRGWRNLNEPETGTPYHQ